jgi:squalene/oxidosqualene cyclase-like protein
VLHNTLEHPWVRAVLHMPLTALRRRALAFCFDYIHAEDVHTNWVDIGPVSKAFHLIATHARWGPASAEFLNHVGRIDDYLWMAEDGLKMQGYNGSMFWDTCFATHAVASTLVACERLPAPPRSALDGIQACLARACEFVDDMQVREDVWRRHDFFRDRSLGGWPFSTRDHGWPISDCTAEGIKAALLLEERLQGRGLRMVPRERIEQAVRIILDLQNSHKDHGWASYELNRGYDWYELFNPAQVFGDIMVDYSYVECSSAAVQALCEYAHRYPDGELAARALDAARRGAGFIVAKQRPDGAWYGSWAVCFTYAAWFGVEGLAAALGHCHLPDRERKAALAALHKGCQFLLDKQRVEDGGWGEDVRSCAEQHWVECDQGGQVVQTGWAVMALVKAAELLAKEDPASTKRFIASATRGSQFLRARQLPSGDWDQECISGVFNKSCAITYTAYRNVFPIWALARYSDYVNRTAGDH